MTTLSTTSPPEGFEREQLPGAMEFRSIVGATPADSSGTFQIISAAAGLEARAKSTGKKMLVGYGSVADQRTTIQGWFMEWDEEVAQGAWAKSIDEGDVRSMFNHDTNRLLGRTKPGTLRLSEDTTGLLYETDINADDTNALSVYAQVARGDVDGSSVWFRVVRQEWTYPTKSNGLERPLRRILEGELFETGPVVFPAFEQTTSTARALQPFDSVLRAAGIEKAGRRARAASELVSELVANPAALEAELRSLFTSAPDLRDAVCSCSTSNDQPHRAAPKAPGDGNGTPPEGHLPDEYFQRRARAIAARYGLPLTKER